MSDQAFMNEIECGLFSANEAVLRLAFDLLSPERA